MLVMCAGFICSCNDDVEETPPVTIIPPDGNVTENKDTHEYVDLGLPSGTLWATCNVGANSPEEYGDYFAWGETTTKGTYDWSTYKHCKGTDDTMTKYCTSSSYGTVDNKTELEPSDDAATVNWDSGWQMPSLEQLDELYSSSYTTTTWTTMNGVYGRKITSKSNGNSIFLPAAGYRLDTSLSNAGRCGFCWSRSLNTSYSYHAYYLYFPSSIINTRSNGDRCCGRSVRPVRILENKFVMNIDLNKTEIRLTPNKSTQLMATVLPWYATNKNVKWECSNNDVATVINGFVVTIAPGTCTITCSATDGSGVKAECKVTVKNDNSGTLDGHDYVDLGLPSGTLWATCNVGANRPEEYGDYFAWGETEPKNDYYWDTYKYCQGTETTLTKYCTRSSYGTVDNKTELELSDDAATANWGVDWQMPSLEQLDELYSSSYTTTTWIGGGGRWITSKSNGNSIFLPAAGYRLGTSRYTAGSDGGGYYWSRSLGTGDSGDAYALFFFSSGIHTSRSYRCYGQSVRPVRVKN